MSSREWMRISAWQLLMTASIQPFVHDRHSIIYNIRFRILRDYWRNVSCFDMDTSEIPKSLYFSIWLYNSLLYNMFHSSILFCSPFYFRYSSIPLLPFLHPSSLVTLSLSFTSYWPPKMNRKGDAHQKDYATWNYMKMRCTNT